MLELFNYGVAACLVGFTLLYVAKYRASDPDVYSPAAAWVRAFIYFSACFFVSWQTGTQEMILNTPLWTEAQLADSSWLYWTVGVTAFIVFAYWGIWIRYTIRFDRKLHLLTQIPFGIIWGLSMGQVVLIVWHYSLGVGAEGNWALWQVWLLAWSILGVWQWAWQDFGWDIYISPEHDSPWSIPVKTALSHIPNVSLCLWYVGLYENYAILIGLQTVALIGASVGMRMPAPWSKEVTPPARRVKLIGWLHRAGGYLSPDPENDKYLKDAHLPR